MNAVKRFIGNLLLYTFHLLVVRPVVFIIAGTNIRRRNLVPEGPCIVVANHNSHLDAGILMSLFPLRRLKHIHPVAAADYFGKNAFRRMLAMLLMNGIPIERKAAPGEDPLEPIVKALDEGESLIFFPEGSRGEAGVLARFRPGIGKLVKAVPGLLVVPVFMSGPERIWPRGQMVPVPLNSSATVGKPRTFPPDMDAREIADKLRNTVLALAPPPPPVPGPRPAPPIRVAVCGIDEHSRHELFMKLAERLGGIDKVIGLSDPVVVSDSEGIRDAAGGIPITRSRILPAFLASLFRTSGLFKGYKFAEMVERARIDEAMEDGRSARFVVGDGNPLVDVLAWAKAYFYREKFDDKEVQQLLRYVAGKRRIPAAQWWKFIRKAPEVWLLNFFDLARPPCPDVLVIQKVDPERAMARLRSRGKSLERFEKIEFLSLLQETYGYLGTELKRWRRVAVVSATGDGDRWSEVSEEVEAACKKLNQKQHSA